MKNFKKQTMIIIFLAILGFLFFYNINLPSIQAAGEVWTFVDGNLSTGLNKDSARHAINPDMEVFNNELYVIWSEFNSSTSQIRVRKYNGSTWSLVDGGGSDGINYSTGENAILPNLIVFNGNLYVIWSETYNGVYVTRVKRYDGGSTWTSIDGSVSNGLNKDSATCGSTSGPSFGICNGYLYAAWVETYSGAGGAYQLHIKRYDSGSSWTFVDGGGFTGLNYDTTKSANKPKLCSINNELYLIWTEANPSGKYIIRVKRYDGGSTWTTVDNGSGLNYNSGNTVDEARLITYNDSLYAYWMESYFIRMKSYNGSAWSTADSNAGFKQKSSNYVYADSPPAAIPYNNKIYFSWGEDIDSLPYPIQTRAAYYYNGAMTFIDGNDSTTGLNYDQSQHAYKQSTIEYNGALYVAWYESNGSANQIRVRSTPLPAFVTSVTDSGNGMYRMNTNFDLYVTFNKAVNITGTPFIPITLSSGTVNASYISGSGTATLAFRYTVGNGDADADGVAPGTSISLNGGTIRDMVNSLDADLNLNNVASTTGVLIDGVPPAISSLSPADNAVQIGLNDNLNINFDSNIVKGTGNITIKKTADDSTVETISVSDSKVTVNSNSATIDPSVIFESETRYYVLIDAGVFQDALGNNFAGINTKTAWNFKTIDMTAPSGYRVLIDQDYINNNNKLDLSFTFSGAEVGTIYSYTLTSDSGGTPVTGSGTIVNANQQVTGVTTIGLNKGKLTLRVTLTDDSGNTGPEATDTISKTVWDEAAPTITSGTIASSNGYIDIVFSEGVYGADIGATGLTAGDLALTFAVNGGTATNAVISAVKQNNSASATAASALTGGETTIRVFLTVTGAPNGLETIEIKPANDTAIYDRAGNAVPASETTGAKLLTKKTAPTLVSANRTDNTHLVVTLSEDCANLAKANNGGFAVVETGNSAKTYAVTATAQGADAGHIVLTVANMAVSGKEGVTVKYTAGTYGTVRDTAGNAMVSNNKGVTVTPWDSEAPRLVSAVRTDNTHLTLALSENCVNLAKKNNGGFTVTAAANPAKTYAVTATAQGADTGHIVLTIASSKEEVIVKYAASGNGTIQDIAGNALATDSTGVSAAADTSAPAIISGTLATSNGYIDIAFSEGVYGAVTGTTGLSTGDLALTFAANGGTATNAVISAVKKNSSTSASAASPLAGGETMVRVFLTVSGTTNGVETIEIKPASDTAIYDQAGNAVTAIQTTGAKLLNEKTAPTLVSASRTDNTHLVVTLSEDCINLVKANNGGFTVIETGNPGKTYAVTATAQGGDAGHIILTVANMAVSGKEGVTVKYTAGKYGTIGDTAGNAMSSNSTGVAVAAWDAIAPTIESATRTDNTHLTLTLSESCVNLTKKNNGGFTVTTSANPAKTYAVIATAQGADASHIVLTIASSKEEVVVKYTAGSNGTIQDIAGNPLANNDIGVTAAADTNGPTIIASTLAASNSYIDIVFSEGVYGASTGMTGITKEDLVLSFTNNGGTATNAVISAVKKNNSTSATTASALSGGETTVRVFLTVTGIPSGVETIEIQPKDGTSIYDQAGNALSASETTGVKILNEKVAPTLVSASRTDSTHLIVTLSEDCINLVKANNGGFTVQETGNPKKVYTVTATTQGTDTNHLILTVANMAVSGKEGVAVKYTAGTNGTIRDTAGNAMASNSKGVTVAAWDSEAPRLLSAVRSDNTHLILTLSESCANLVKKNNGGFTVTETDNPAKTYAVTATTQGADASHIILTVSSMIVSGNEGVTVKYTAGPYGTIQDIAGNSLATDNTGVKVAVWDEFPPTIISGTLAASNGYIDIVFNEGVYGSDTGRTGITSGDLTLTFNANGGKATNAVISSVRKNNSSTASKASALTGGETTVRVFLTVYGTPNGLETIQIRPTDGASIYDQAGNAVSILRTTGVKLLNDKIAPTLVSAIRADNTHLVVALSENCVNLAKKNNSGFTVIETGNPKRAYAVITTAQGDDASHIILTVANMRESGRKGVTVKYTAGTYGTVRDIAGNSLASNSKGLALAVWDLPVPTESHTVEGVSFNMRRVPGGLTFPTDSNMNTFQDDSTATVTNAYWIAETEVTYELWYVVYVWAVSHGYKFDHLDYFPREGSDGARIPLTGSPQVPTGAPTNEKYEPVTRVCWRDAIVWCNALSELAGVSPVYKSGSQVVKDATNLTVCDDVSNPADGDKGFRLPASNEWELAARYKGNDDLHGAIEKGGLYWTPGTYASGAAEYAANNLGVANPNQNSTIAVAVYNTDSTAKAKSKNADAMGLYDMSGNVWEWCFDRYSSSKRVARGGGLYSEADDLRLGYVYDNEPSTWSSMIGFRIVRTD